VADFNYDNAVICIDCFCGQLLAGKEQADGLW
jgi:hypothetical protein